MSTCRELSSPLIPHDLILKLIKVNEGQQGKQVEAASKLLCTMEEPHRWNNSRYEQMA